MIDTIYCVPICVQRVMRVLIIQLSFMVRVTGYVFAHDHDHSHLLGLADSGRALQTP